MAEFPVFSAPGPNVDVRLFGEAAETGAKLGEQIPSAFSSAVSGGLEGYKEGLSEYAEQARTAEVQAQTEQIQQNMEIQKEQQAMRDAQLKNEQAVADLNRMKVEVQTQTEAEQIAANKAQLQAESVDNQIKAFDRNNISKVNDAFQSGPTGYNNILQDPGLQATFSRNHDLALNTYGGIIQSKTATPEQKAEAQRRYDIVLQQQQDIADLKNKKESADLADKAFQKAKVDLYDKGGKVLANMNDFKLTEADLASDRVQFFPAGLKDVDPKTKMLTGNPDHDLSLAKAGPGYEMFVDGKRANNIVLDKEHDIAATIKRGYYSNNLPVPQSTYNYNSAPAIGTPATTAAPPGRPFLGMFSDWGKASAPPPGSWTPTLAPTATPIATSEPTDNRSLPVPTPSPQPLHVESGDNQIERQAAARLLQEAQNNPEHYKRLAATGLLQGMQPTATPTAPGTVAPAPEVIPGTSSATTQQPQSTATPLPPAAAPSARTPSEPPQNVDFKSMSFAPGVDKGVVKKVITDENLAGLSPEEKAIVAVESSGNKDARNKGAEGYFQLRSGAEAHVSQLLNRPIDRTNVKDNIEGGRKYYAYLKDHYQDQAVPALMAYNLGVGVVDAAIQVSGSMDYRDIVNGLEYLKYQNAGSPRRERRFGKQLTDENIKAAAAYPGKVLSYVQAFNTVGS